MSKAAEAQPLPYNVEAEEAVLGSLILDNDAMPLVAFLDWKDFYREKNQWVFRMIQSLYRKGMPFDPITICDELALHRRKPDGGEKKNGKKADEYTYLDAIGGPAAISELMMRIPTAIHVEHYARIVERHSLLRRLIGAGERVRALAYEKGDEDVTSIIVEAEQILLRATQRISWQEPVDHREALQTAMDDYLLMAGKDGKSRAGIPTCSKDLNRLIGGFKPGELYSIAARPGMGKSSQMLAHARAAIAKGYTVLIFSLEMSTRQLTNRLVAAEAGVDLQLIGNGPIPDDILELMTQAAERLRELPGTIIIDDSHGLTADEIRAKTLRRAAKGEPIDMVWIDHLQEVRNAKSTGHVATTADIVSQKMATFVEIAKDLQAPVGVLCQLNRECEKRANKRPMLSDLKDSSAIEEKSDVVIFIYRDDVYDPNTDRPGIAESITAKHRSGPKGVVDMRFIGEYGQWRDLETFDADDIEAPW